MNHSPLWSFLPTALLLFAQSNLLPQNKTIQQAGGAEPHVVQVAMKNVMYHFTEGIMVHIGQLQGYLAPAEPEGMVAIDDKNSFLLHLASAEVAIRCDVLAQAVNENVFGSKDAPIKAITIASQGNQLIIKGKLNKKEGVSFEAIGTLSVDDTGLIRVHIEHLKAAHLPLKGVLDLLGVDMARMINTKKVRGVSIEKDDLLLDPEQILPPPRIRGKVTAIRIQGAEIVQVFGEMQKSNFVAEQPGNYIACRGGDLRVGNLTIHDRSRIYEDNAIIRPARLYARLQQAAPSIGCARCEAVVRLGVRQSNCRPPRLTRFWAAAHSKSRAVSPVSL
jgi:hypothetical protein